MSSPRELPFNISILKLSQQRLQFTRPVTSLDIFDGATRNFHDDGLFSTAIFGRFGEDKRDKTFSYVDVKTDILHPIIYENFCKLRNFYKEIATGKAYAVWDDVAKDFVPSDSIDGKTGYSFFINHCLDIEFKPTKSNIRRIYIQVIEKYKEDAKTRQVLILPAGLRDIDVGDDGRYQQHEVNDVYRRLIGVSNLLGNAVSGVDDDNPALNQSRLTLQNAFNGVFDIFKNIVKGKGGFGQNKWASRRIYNGTQNVISAMDPSVADLDAPNAMNINDTVVGMFQLAKAIEPVTVYYLRNSIVGSIFDTSGSARGFLVNKDTLVPEFVTVNPKNIDLWTSYEGLAKIIELMRENSYRHKPIVIDGYYLALVYRGPDGTFRVFNDIRELPPERSIKDVHPITYYELLYLSGYREWNKFPAFVTRYPITSIGSIYPGFSYVKTTVNGEVRKELGMDWELLGDSYIAYEYPMLELPVYMDTMSPNLTRLQDLGAD